MTTDEKLAFAKDFAAKISTVEDEQLLEFILNCIIKQLEKLNKSLEEKNIYDTARVV